MVVSSAEVFLFIYLLLFFYGGWGEGGEELTQRSQKTAAVEITKTGE